MSMEMVSMTMSLYWIPMEMVFQICETWIPITMAWLMSLKQGIEIKMVMVKLIVITPLKMTRSIATEMECLISKISIAITTVPAISKIHQVMFWMVMVMAKLMPELIAMGTVLSMKWTSSQAVLAPQRMVMMITFLLR